MKNIRIAPSGVRTTSLADRGRAVCFIALLATLAGCTTTRYVKVPCLTPEQFAERQKAEPEKVGGSLTGQAQEDVRIIGANAKELRAWGEGNLRILGGCVG